MSSENLLITLSNGEQITINLFFSRGYKRIKLSLIALDNIRLSVPSRTSAATIQQFIKQHNDWLEKNIAALKISHSEIIELTPFVSNTLLLRGENHNLQWHLNPYLDFRVENNTIHFYLPEKYTSKILKAALKQFYSVQAKNDIALYLHQYLPTISKKPTKIQLKMVSSQWGSLSSSGALSLDLSLILAKPEIFEYVVVHELCHFLHANHSSDFWYEVEQRLPNWKTHHNYLKTHGNQIKAQLKQLVSL